MFLNKLSALVAVLCSLSALQAQEAIDSIQTQSLDEVVVTATRTIRQLSDIPLPVTIISKKQIQNTGVIRLNEILNEQTGIITVSDESGFDGVQIQGIASDYILILINGVPLVGRSSGNFDLSRLTVGNIKQVEVVKGPSSSLYGSEALGGVINIITENPAEAQLNGNTSYRFASFNTHDANINLNQQTKKLGYAIFANSLHSQGYDLAPETPGQTVSPFQNYTIHPQVWYSFSDRLKMYTSGRLYNQKQEAAVFVDNELYEGDSDINEFNIHGRLDHTVNERLSFQYEFYRTNYKATELLQSPVSNTVLSESDFDQKLARPEIRGIYNFSPKQTVTLGLGYNHENLDRTFFDERVVFNSQYIYAQYDFHPLEKLNLILGSRFDHHSEYSSQLSPKFSAHYSLSPTISLKGSVGYGFKAPDFRQLYFDFMNSAVGYSVLGYNVAVEKIQALEEQGQLTDILFDYAELNAPLQPESSVGYNLGAVHTHKKLKTEINFFRNDFKNLIDTRIVARKTNGQNVFSYVNFNRIYTTGAEFNSSYTLSNNLTISAGYQLLFARDKDKEAALKRNEVFARNPETLQTVLLSSSDYFGLINRSRHTANFKLFYDIPKWKANANFRINYRSKYGLFDGNGNGILDTYDTSFVDGYALVNVTLNKSISDRYALQIGANNLFDYTDVNNIPGLPGIQFFTKLNINF